FFHATLLCILFTFFFFNDSASSELYTLSLHDALPISLEFPVRDDLAAVQYVGPRDDVFRHTRALRLGTIHLQDGEPQQLAGESRSEEHTSELQSRGHLVCRLLLEKKKKVKSGKTAATP